MSPCIISACRRQHPPAPDPFSLPEESLAQSEARYRALVEGSSDFIYVLDKDGRFTFANAESMRLLGYAPEKIIGKHFSEILHPEDVDAAGRSFHERRTGERASHRVEVRLNSRGGGTRQVELDIRHFSLSASGLYDGEDFLGTHGVARDITERKYYDDRHTVLQTVREAVWTMVGTDDIQKVLGASGTLLKPSAFPTTIAASTFST